MEDQIFSTWLGELVKLGGWGFAVFMILSGRFVPRWVFDRLEKQLEREVQARQKAEELGDAALTATKVAQQTLEALTHASERRTQ